MKVKSETVYEFTPDELKEIVFAGINKIYDPNAKLDFEIKDVGGTSYAQGEVFPVPTVISIKLIVR